MQAQERPHRLIVLLAALQAFGPLSIDMYLPGLPAIAKSLNGSNASIQLTISAFLLGLFLGMLFYGPLSDKFGRRPLLLGGLALYVIASLGCCFAQSSGQLIALRFAQALGAAAASVLGRTIVRDLFPIQEAAPVLSLMHLVTMVATFIAPLSGSYLLAHFGWRSLFVALIMFSGITLWLTAWKIPESHATGARTSSLRSVFGAYLTIIRHRKAVGYILCMALSFAGMFAYITASPFVYIQFFGVLPEHYAWLFSLNIGAIILFVALNAALVKRLGTQLMLLIGTTISASSGVLLLIGGLFSIGGLSLIVIGLLGFVGVTGLLGANCMASLLKEYPRQAGAVSGLAIATQFGLGALASAGVSMLNNGTPLPMTLLVGLAGLGSFFALRQTRSAKPLAQTTPS